MPDPEQSLIQLLDHIKPGSSRRLKEAGAWEPPAFGTYEDIREWLKESVMSATLYERYPDGRWTIQIMLKEQVPSGYKHIVL
ncbi:MAG: hypothetical protein HY014_05740 [Acidobacteria bacterium]|nr:hypothetical protein [Acidobacteriota bacterium]MBI3487650.1 hypothetical protein [Acidobacteriota bacterium]